VRLSPSTADLHLRRQRGDLGGRLREDWQIAGVDGHRDLERRSSYSDGDLRRAAVQAANLTA
jgi:hypothetical protein